MGEVDKMHQIMCVILRKKQLPTEPFPPDDIDSFSTHRQTVTGKDGQNGTDRQNLYREKQMLYYMNISHSTQQHNYVPTNYNTTRACSQASGSFQNAPVVPVLGLSRAHVRHNSNPPLQGHRQTTSPTLYFFYLFFSSPATSMKHSLTHCYSNTHTHIHAHAH